MTPPKQRVLVPLVWIGVMGLVIVPVLIAAQSPFLAGRNPAYIIAGFAGIVGLGLLVVQPLLAAGYLPGLRLPRRRRLHRMLGAGILLAVVLHVGGLYLTSAPDTIDALLLVSPTPFSVYGVIAMWGIFATGALVGLRNRLGLRYSVWRIIHNAIAALVVIATVIHALQIDGTMGDLSKLVVCMAALIATGVVLMGLHVFGVRRKPQ